MKVIKSRWKDQYYEIDANSKFHNKIRDFFARDRFFCMLRCYQEVPVADLVPDYPSNMHRFDWYIDELNTVVELHGRQHYEAVAFGTTSYEEVQATFKATKRRDKQKKTAAISAGYNYVEIPYTIKLDDEVIKNLILRGAQ